MKIYTIYKIYNTKNSKIYIGFTSNFKKRIKKHIQDCMTSDVILYRAMRKHGINNFYYEIIYQSKDKTHTKDVMERYFIEEYRSYIGFKDCNGYNMTLGGEGFFGNRHFTTTIKFKLVDPNGNIISGKNLRKYCTKNNLPYRSMLSVLHGKQKSCKGYKNVNNKYYVPKDKREFILYDEHNNVVKFNNKTKFCKDNNLYLSSLKKLFNGSISIYKGYTLNYKTKKYSVLYKDELVEFDNLADFCKNNNLNYNIMYKIINGSTVSHKGYRCSIKINREFKIYDENDNLIILDNVKKFCRDNDLNYSSMINLIDGSSKYYKGYKNINYKDYIPFSKRIIKLKDPNGNVIEINSINLFAKQNGLDSRSLYRVAKGECKSHKGYTAV